MAAEGGRQRLVRSGASQTDLRDRGALLSLDDVTRGGTAALVAKVAGDALAAPAAPRQPGAAPASVLALLERFERWADGASRAAGRLPSR
jgi:hypothetical protein